MRRSWLSAPLLLSALAGCELAEEINDKLGSDETTFAEDAIAAVEITRVEAAMVAAVVDGIPLTDQDTAAMATAAAAAAATTFTPADCVEAVATGSSVTYTFDACAGPRGLDGVSGVASATFSVPGIESVTVSLTSSDLAAGDAVGTLNTTGTYSLEGDGPLLALTTSGVSQASSGDVLGRVGGYTAIFDADCIDLDGQWTTTVNDETFWTTGVQGYHACAGECPASGQIGHANVENPDDMADPFEGSGIVVTLSGEGTAPFVDSEGNPGIVVLECP